MHYFEPDGVPEHIQKEKEKHKRIIKIRFESPKDVNDFIEKTGIRIPHRSLYKMQYPLTGLYDIL